MPAVPPLYVITSEVVAHFIRTTKMLTGIPLYGVNTRITKFADDTSIFVTKWEEINTVFQIFDWYKLASGSRLKTAKTQLLPLGSFKNREVPLVFQNFAVDKLKIYGVWVNNGGFELQENWVKSGETIEKLNQRIPPYGTSFFGKIHHVMIYYLCMFNYVSNVTTPSSELIKKHTRLSDVLSGILRMLTLLSKIY